MSTKEDKEEKERRNKIEVIKYLGKFWNVKQNILPERMPQKQTFYKKEMKNLIDALLEGNIDIKEKLIQLRNKKQLNKSSSTDNLKYISPNSKTLIAKIKKNVKKISNSILDITRMNGLFLGQTTRKTFNTYRTDKNKKSLKKINFKTENFLLENLNKDGNELNQEQKDKKKNNKMQRIKKFTTLNDTNKKKREIEIIKDRYVKNFAFVNDNYRRQFNFAFLKYNPTKHLEDLKFLVETEPLIGKDIIRIKKDVEDDIKFRCDKNHFRKKYEYIKKRFQRSSSVETNPKTQFHTFKNGLLPSLKDKKFNQTIKVSTPSFSKKSVINSHEIKKYDEESKLSKLVFPKEEKIEELKHMLMASTGINTLIQKENIDNKIDMYRTKYEEKVKLNELYDIKNINLLEKDYFEEEKKNIINQLGDIYQFQMDKNLKEKENKLNGKILNVNDAFGEKLSEEKKGALKEINNLIEDHIFLN